MTANYPASILPPNATAVEQAIDRASAAALERLPVYLIRWVKDPDSCPLALLPWLAWEYQLILGILTGQNKRNAMRSSAPTISTAIVGRSPPSVMPRGQSFGTDIVEWFNQNPKGSVYLSPERLSERFAGDEYDQQDLKLAVLRARTCAAGFPFMYLATSGNLCGRLHVRHGENHARFVPLQVILSATSESGPGDAETVTVTILLNTRKIKPLR